MTCPANDRPAPKPMTSAVSPDLAWPCSSNASMATGIDAAEELPIVQMSRLTTTFSGSFRWRSIESVMRLLAWCGMKTSSWSGVSPAAAIASADFSAMKVVAQRKT